MTNPDDKAISPCNSNSCHYQAQCSTVEIDINPNSRRLAFCETSVQPFHCPGLCQYPGPPTPQISIAGRWLEMGGFTVGRPLILAMHPELLIIGPDYDKPVE